MINAVSGKINTTNGIKSSGASNQTMPNIVAFKGLSQASEEVAGKVAKKVKFEKMRNFFGKMGSKIKEFAIFIYNKFPQKAKEKAISFKSFVVDKFKKSFAKAKDYFANIQSRAAARKEANASKKIQSKEAKPAGSPSLEPSSEGLSSARIDNNKIQGSEKNNGFTQTQKVENGKLTETIDLDAAGKPVFKTEFDNGKKVSETTYKNNVPYETVYFDKDGKKTDILRFSFMGSVLDREKFLANGERILTKYTTNGEKIVAVLRYSADDKLISHSKANTILF